jgi:glycosyltransferase involved in cell wall biosynthesis
MKKRTVLLCADSIRPEASGGCVTLRMIELLNRENFEIHILTSDKNLPKNPPRVASISQHPIYGSSALGFYRKELASNWYRQLLLKAQPTVIHFCSFHGGSRVFMLKIAKELGIRIVMQPWTSGYFCRQTYAYDEVRNEECYRCLEAGFNQALKQGCDHGVSGRLRSLLKIRLQASSIEMADCWLSSGGTTAGQLRSYGVPDGRITYFPLPFPPDRVAIHPVVDGEEIIAYGGPKFAKGFHLLRQIAENNPLQRFVYFSGSPAWKHLLGEAPLPGNLLVDETTSWQTGLEARVAAARAILIPTLWPTTPEYVLLESLGYAKPVIAYNVGAHKKILTNGINALVAEKNDHLDFSNKVAQVSTDPELRKSLSAGAKQCFMNYTDSLNLTRILMESYGFLDITP